MSVVIGYAVKHALCLSRGLYRSCAGQFGSFGLLYGLSALGFFGSDVIVQNQTVHLQVSGPCYYDETQQNKQQN